MRPGAPWRSLRSLLFVWFFRCTLMVVGFVQFVWFVRAHYGGTSGSSRCALSVARFVWTRMDRPGAPWVSLTGSSGSSRCAVGDIKFVRVFLFYPCSLAMEVAGFVLVSLVRPGTPWWSLDSVRLVWVLFCDRWVRFGSSGCAPVVAGFVQVRLVRSGCALGVAGFVQVRLVCPGAH